MATYDYLYNPYQQPNYNEYYSTTAVPAYNPPSYQQQRQQSMLNGKLVENVDVVKTAEVPIGGYGIFPKADFSEVYIKAWNSNGTTNLLTYKLAEGTPDIPQNNLTQINEKLSSLEEKLDTVISNSKKKEVKINEY